MRDTPAERAADPGTGARNAVDRFAAAHLKGRAERAVFGVLMLGPSEYWTVSDVAVHLRADDHVVGAVLRQFSAIGIVDVQSSELGATRYRIRSTSSFLAEAAGVFTDPVCGMRVSPDTRFVLSEGGVTTARFCSQRCLLLWDRRVRDTLSTDEGGEG